MIAAIHGTLEGKLADAALVRVGGFTLMIHLPAPALDRLGKVGREVHLHTYLQLREDGAALYGFTSPEELSLFQALISVSGVGPRIALSLLSTLTPEQLSSALVRGDAETLSRAAGVGKKLAGRLVVELRDKVARAALAAAPATGGDDAEVLAALTSLGYTLQEAAAALASLRPSSELPVEERVRLALQFLASR